MCPWPSRPQRVRGADQSATNMRRVITSVSRATTMDLPGVALRDRLRWDLVILERCQ
jgi:hypothetical protein